MNPRILFFAGASVLVLSPLLFGQKSTSDLQPPVRRQKSVEIAERLSRPPAPAPVPEDLPQPFNPPGFDLPEGVEPGAAEPTTTLPTTPAPPVAGDREILETLAGRLPSASYANRGGKAILIMGTNRFEIGQSFIATDPKDGKDYQLEIIAIGPTTFTLRYRNEEFTRPNRNTR